MRGLRTAYRSDLAEQVIELVKRATSGKAEAEVLAATTTVSFTRFANSFIHQNMTDTATAVRLRLHLDGRTATGSTTNVSKEGLSGLVDRTITAGRLLPEDPGWAGLAPPRSAATEGNFDEETASSLPASRAQIVRDFVDATEGLECAGFCQSSHALASFANSAGQVLNGGETNATIDGIARTGSSDGSARRCSVKLSDLDGAAFGALAAKRARSSSDPVELPSGEYEVVLEPSATADIMTWLAYGGFNGRAVAEGRSFVKIGEQQFDPLITMIDDATAADAIGLPFDAEGTPKLRTVVVSGGICGTILHDRRTAKEVGAESTGHAIPGGEGFGAFPINFILEPGAGEKTTEHLVREVKRGLLVTEFHYTNMLDPRSLVVTGLTRNGLWLIEDGQPTKAVKNFRFTQSYPAAMAPGAVLGVASNRTTVPIAFEGVGFSAPSIRLASWHFTGGATG